MTVCSQVAVVFPLLLLFRSMRYLIIRDSENLTNWINLSGSYLSTSQVSFTSSGKSVVNTQSSSAKPELEWSISHFQGAIHSYSLLGHSSGNTVSGLETKFCRQLTLIFLALNLFFHNLEHLSYLYLSLANIFFLRIKCTCYLYKARLNFTEDYCLALKTTVVISSIKKP